MAGSVFLDTSGWLALLNSGDPLHQSADRIWRQVVGSSTRVVFTDWIIAETGNGSARSKSRHRFVDAVKAILGDSRVELIVVDSELLFRSLQFFVQHSDKFYGLVDCVSFIIMRDRGIFDAFTSDVHFEQAGFARLLIP
jgi:uncharacterized protein